MNKKLNKLVTNYPVELNEEEIENLSATLAPVIAACGGGGGTGGKIYTGTGFVNVNNTTNQIGLTEDANDKLNKEYVEYNEYSTAIANRYTKTQTNALLDEKQDTLEFEYDEDNKVSAINGSALAGQGGTTYTPGQYINIDSNNEISVTGLVAIDEYATYSGDWNDVSNSYKTNSGSFLTSEALTNYATKTYVDGKDPVLIGDSNITAASSTVDGHTQWNLSVNATPVVTDTKLVGDNCVTAHTTQTSGEWIVGLEQTAYEAIDSVGGIATDVATLKNASAGWNDVTAKLDASVASTTYQTKGNYITSSDLVDSAKSATFAEYLTDGTDTSSFSEIKGSIDWCNTIADHYQTHSGEFVTSSISTITGTKQYALTSAGWVEVQAGSLSIPINVGTGNALNISTAESGTWGNNADGYLVIGHRSKAGNESFVFGNDSIAQNNSTVLNGGNSALHDSIAQGWKNIAIERSQAFGYNSSASKNSLAAGYSVVATDYSFAGGQAYNSTRGNILATDHSFALGVGSNNEPVIANKYSFAFGYAPSAQNFAFAFGKAIDVEGSDGHAVIGVGGYNVKIPSAAIIVGNGTNNARHNAFVVYNDGNVSAKNYKAEGYTDSNNNYVEASVPKSIPNTGDNSMKVQKMFVCTSDADIVAHAALANGEGCVFFRVG